MEARKRPLSFLKGKKEFEIPAAATFDTNASVKVHITGYNDAGKYNGIQL